MFYIAGRIDGVGFVLEFASIDVGSTISEENEDNGQSLNFVGHMTQLIFNSDHVFEIAQKGDASNIEQTALFGKREHIIQRPVTFQAPSTYVAQPQLNAFSHLNVYFQFKTLTQDGLILYSAGKENDFMVVELVKGHVHFIFDMGDGARVVRSMTQRPLNDLRWHDVTITKLSLSDHALVVDGTVARATDTGPAHHLDLEGYVYVGGVPSGLYSKLSKVVQSRMGFQGCFGSLNMNGRESDLLNGGLEGGKLIVEGCQGKSS